MGSITPLYCMGLKASDLSALIMPILSVLDLDRAAGGKKRTIISIGIVQSGLINTKMLLHC